MLVRVKMVFTVSSLIPAMLEYMLTV